MEEAFPYDAQRCTSSMYIYNEKSNLAYLCLHMLFVQHRNAKAGMPECCHPLYPSQGMYGKQTQTYFIHRGGRGGPPHVSRTPQ